MTGTDLEPGEVIEDVSAERGRPQGTPLGWSIDVPRADLVACSVVLVAAAAWVLGLRGADPRSMTELGLVSLFTPPMVAALVLLTVGFVLALRRGAPGWVLGLHVVVLILLIHGTPPALYDTLRYSWAWKHTGIVEFITRTGSVDTTVERTPIYHAWPGFFAGSALMTELAAHRHAARLAMWAPVVFNLSNLLATRALFRTLTGSHRIVWLSIWLFFITNWVGQDYFSPQAMAYLLYLVTIAVVLRGFRRREPTPPVLAAPLPRRAALAVTVLLLAAMASSHQITPFLAVVVLAGLVVFRQVRGWYLPAIAGGLTAVWAVTVGRGELQRNAESLVDSFGQPIANAEQSLEKAATVVPAQQVISQAGRLVVVALALAALFGVVRSWRSRTIDPAVLVIAATPVALPLATEFGGEAIFRVFLFAVPALAFLAASALHPPDDATDATRPRWSHPRTATVLLVSAGLLCAYLLAHFGKDKQYHFTDEEIAAVTWVAENARDGSLLVEGSRNYPSHFLNYERFTYVAIAREPAESRERVLRDPERHLARWLDNEAYADTYVIITRSQKVEVDLDGSLPQGSLERIERILRRSDRFRVAYSTRDAVVFELEEGARR